MLMIYRCDFFFARRREIDNRLSLGEKRGIASESKGRHNKIHTMVAAICCSSCFVCRTRVYNLSVCAASIYVVPTASSSIHTPPPHTHACMHACLHIINNKYLESSVPSDKNHFDSVCICTQTYTSNMYSYYCCAVVPQLLLLLII